MASLTANRLKKIFKVTARFYNIQYDDKNLEKCRSILEIRRINTNDKLNDGFVIMMNPGSSEPFDQNYRIKTFKKESFDSKELLNIGLVITKPDVTQYKIMRVMETNDLNYVNVINLSDIRESKSNLFYKKLKEMKTKDVENIHSIFSKKREPELNDVFGKKRKLKIISAWGVNDYLDDLIQLAYESNRLKNAIGYQKKFQPKFYHPLHSSDWEAQISNGIKKV